MIKENCPTTDNAGTPPPQTEPDMQAYLGVKMISAKPMNMNDYFAQSGRVIPEEMQLKFAEDEPGYLVEYEATGSEKKGYQSWSPKEVFEKAYRLCDQMTFGLAVEATGKGLKVARSGWNGKNMHVALQVPDEHSANTLPYLYMITVTGDRVPWLASQTDMLAEDWEIVE